MYTYTELVAALGKSAVDSPGATIMLHLFWLRHRRANRSSSNCASSAPRVAYEIFIIYVINLLTVVITMS